MRKDFELIKVIMEIGLFLTRTAVAGIQVMLETHSDHVLNGVRRAVKEKIINDENVAVHFFMPRSQEDNAQVVSPIMKNDDKLDSLSRWVAGFVFYCVKNRNPPPTLQPRDFLMSSARRCSFLKRAYEQGVLK